MAKKEVEKKEEVKVEKTDNLINKSGSPKIKTE